MPSKNGKKKVAKAPAKLDAQTGCREGSLGYAIGKAYLAEKGHEKAVEAVEDVIKGALKGKGKSTKDEYVHARAVSWIAFLKDKMPAKYKDLPKVKKAEEKKEAVAA